MEEFIFYILLWTELRSRNSHPIDLVFRNTTNNSVHQAAIIPEHLILLLPGGPSVGVFCFFAEFDVGVYDVGLGVVDLVVAVAVARRRGFKFLDIPAVVIRLECMRVERQRILFLWRQVDVAKEQCIVLPSQFNSESHYQRYSAHKACAIAGNVSSSRLAGWIPITPRPKSPRLDLSMDGGQGKMGRAGSWCGVGDVGVTLVGVSRPDGKFRAGSDRQIMPA
ncbi:hypothetical protein BDZ89DRAFT_80132 [Hymenopellis radicata]|nr:hypothetical protein BDZ89DRAFT_80132 [Hymenopellis radicata]